MLANAYFLAKFRFDTAENEPAKNLQKLPKNAKFYLNLQILLILSNFAGLRRQRGRRRQRPAAPSARPRPLPRPPRSPESAWLEAVTKDTNE